MTPDIEATTMTIKGRRTMKKSKMSSKDGFKKFAPAKNAGSAKYSKQKIKGPVKGKLFVGGVKYKGV